MKVTIVDQQGRRHSARIAENNGFVTVRACPSCGAKNATVRGTGITHTDHDTYYAGAIASCCGQQIGTMQTKVDTIFGIEEDARVLGGRWRVY